MTRPTLALLALLLAMFLPASSASADALDDLARAVEKFRGIGHEDVRSYRVELRIPEEGEESVPLEEIWSAPFTSKLESAVIVTDPPDCPIVRLLKTWVPASAGWRLRVAAPPGPTI